MLKGLTESERQKPYAKYFDVKPTVSAEVQAVLNAGQMMPQAKAIIPENGNMDEITSPADIQVETGYCTLDNGCGYIAARHPLPGVSFEMYKWWLEWRFEEDADLRYKIWCPGVHFQTTLAAGFMWHLEDVGNGLEDIFILEGLADQPRRLGIDPEKVKNSNLLMLDGGNATSRPFSDEYPTRPVHCVVMHFIYEEPDGLTMRSRFYLGYRAGETGLIPIQDKTQPVPAQRLRGLLEHNALEMGQLAATVPGLYREEYLDKRG